MFRRLLPSPEGGEETSEGKAANESLLGGRTR